MKMIKQPTIPPMPKRPTFDARDTQYNLPIGTDLISRQAAIDAILHITNCKSVRELFEYNQEHHLTEMWSGGVNDAIDAVIGVESATDTNVATKVGTNLAEVGTDCISRQAAIDALCNDYCGGRQDCKHYPKCENLKAVQNLPSAQPEILACGEGKLNVPDINVGDMISRQAAIAAIDECYCGGEDSCGEPWIYKENAVEAIQMIEPIPPAEPKRGRWILDRSGAYCCSKCMEPCAGYVMMKPRDKFCKMCGSRNEVTE